MSKLIKDYTTIYDKGRLIYNGGVKNNKFHGYGIYYFKNGYEFIGEFANNQIKNCYGELYTYNQGYKKMLVKGMFRGQMIFNRYIIYGWDQSYSLDESHLRYRIPTVKFCLESENFIFHNKN